MRARISCDGDIPDLLAEAHQIAMDLGHRWNQSATLRSALRLAITEWGERLLEDEAVAWGERKLEEDSQSTDKKP